jgi:hypothetical protein
MILALDFRILNQRILVKPFAVLQYRSGNLNRSICCEDANDVARRIGEPCNATSKLRAGGPLDILEKLAMTLSNSSI